jgi:Carboxypeptidase regulatory-like domain
MNATKLLLPILLVLGLGLGVWFAMGSGGAPVPIDDQPPKTEEPAPQTEKPQQAAVATPEAPRVEPQDPARVEVKISSALQSDAPQGIRGRVVLQGGAPAPGMDVFLLKGSTSDPLSLYLAHRRGQKTEPVAQVRTDEQGHFSIGLQKSGDTFDLRVVSDEHPEIQHKSIKVRSEDWYDTGDLVLTTGSIVQGRVLDEEGKFGIAEARVYLTIPGMAHQMLPTPGRERGIMTVTDGSGFFRYGNAPRNGTINLGAESGEYAFFELQNQQIKDNAPNDFTIELSRGLPISGIVVDAQGKPVNGASVLATAQSAKLPQSGQAMSGSDGRFALPILRAGPYQLAVSAPNYEDVIEKPVFAGADDVRIVMEQRGRVRLRVFNAKGQAIKNYTVGLKRYFANNPSSIGKVPEFRDVRITPGDYQGDYANIRNVPNGEFVFQIMDNEHAKTLTSNFTMAADKEPPTVEVTLTLGGAILGQVVDDGGVPVPGATVVTDMNGGIAVEMGFFEMFRSFLPDKHTTRSEKTGPDGRFRLTRLAFADYMIRVSHPDFCEGTSLDIGVANEGEERDVGVIRLRRGAVVEGLCRVSGRGAGQVKVMIGPPTGYKPEIDAQGRPIGGQMFTATAISDGEGRYRFSKRVPPGTYKIHAFKEAGNDDVFGRFKQMKETERPLNVGAGQDVIVQDFDISM